MMSFKWSVNVANCLQSEKTTDTLRIIETKVEQKRSEQRLSLLGTMYFIESIQILNQQTLTIR